MVRRVPRRTVLFGAGSFLAWPGPVTPASGAVVSPHSPSPFRGDKVAASSATSISSPAESGVIYRHLAFYDFIAEANGAYPAWGGLGVFSGNVIGYLTASVEIPHGAIFHDIEWYVANTWSADAVGSTSLWIAGNGHLDTSVTNVLIPPTQSQVVTATRSVVAPVSKGPFPLGTKLVLTMATRLGGVIQINGARVGFLQGGGTVGILPAPIRIYDSRNTGGKLSAGSTHTITIPSSIFHAGITGAIANVTAVNAAGAGYLRLFAADQPAPTTSTLNYLGTGTPIANAITMAVSRDGAFNVFTSQTCDVIVDITGTIG